jgi:RNA polymerase sigma-70 factor (ECF subfamily)
MLDASARGAWELLAERLGTFIGRRLPAEDVEDVRQDVLLRIFKGAPHLHDDERFGPWVYSVARNAVIDRLRSRKLPAGDLAEASAIPDSVAPDDRPLVDCVAVFVARLPSPYRDAIALTELRGLTQQAAADMSGVTLSGMKSRVQRGRRILREMFEECCHLTIDARGRVIEADRRLDQPQAGCSGEARGSAPNATRCGGDCG